MSFVGFNSFQKLAASNRRKPDAGWGGGAGGEKKVDTWVSKRGGVPGLPANKCDVLKNAVMGEVVNPKNTQAAEWGIDRLVWLVDSGLREKVWLQMQRVWQAQESRDEMKLEKAVQSMCRAYQAMEDWARANGVSQLPDVGQIEHQREDGSVLVVVPDERAKAIYCQQWPGTTDREVWTISELAIILAKQAGGKVSEIKQLWPDSKLVAVGGPRT